MDLSTAQQVLVVILATALAVSLVISIVIGIMVIKLVRHVRQVVEKAEHAIASAEAVGEIIRNTAGPIGVLRVMRTVFKMVSKHK
jgi:hypothetical protein